MTEWCLKLWCFYADQTQAHGDLDSRLAVLYDKIHDLGLAAPLLVLKHAPRFSGRTTGSRMRSGSTSGASSRSSTRTRSRSGRST
jgi:hypothetical protein